MAGQCVAAEQFAAQRRRAGSKRRIRRGSYTELMLAPFVSLQWRVLPHFGFLRPVRYIDNSWGESVFN